MSWPFLTSLLRLVLDAQKAMHGTLVTPMRTM